MLIKIHSKSNKTLSTSACTLKHKFSCKLSFVQNALCPYTLFNYIMYTIYYTCKYKQIVKQSFECIKQWRENKVQNNHENKIFIKDTRSVDSILSPCLLK